MTDSEQVAATAIAVLAAVPLGLLSWKLLVFPQDVPEATHPYVVMGALLAFASLGPITALSRRADSPIFRVIQAALFLALLLVGVIGVFGTAIYLAFSLPVLASGAEPEGVAIFLFYAILMMLSGALVASLTIWTDQRKVHGWLLRFPKWIAGFAVLAATAVVLMFR
jgi:hypothetical protein